MILRDYNIQHLKNIKKYLGKTQMLYYENIDQIVRIYSTIPPGTVFSFDNYPGIKQGVNRELQSLAKQLHGSIVQGINNEWTLSNNKNDAILNSLLAGRGLPPMLEEKWMGRNLEALKAFKLRTEKGLGISERVWQTVRIQAINIEQNMALGILEGTPAAKLATEMKQYLNEPDKLFRRVRDAEGKLRLSKPAKAYHPGQGVYRSSYKNALRLTRTETNMAYQLADAERWNKQDFVKGIEVKRSGVGYPCDICESLQGEYPKDYKWSAWHPNCLCYAVPKLASRDQLFDSIDAALDGREYQFQQMTQMPENFKTFTLANNFEHYLH
jgi:hypothetical protein